MTVLNTAVPNGLSSGLAALFVVFVCAAVPLLLLAAASLMAWGYRRTLSGPTGRDLPDLEPVPPGHLAEGPRLSSMGEASPVEVSPAAEQVLEEARYVTRCARIAYVVAALVYAAASTAFLSHSAVKLPVESRVIFPYLVLAPQLLIVTWFIRPTLRQRLWLFLGYIVVGTLLVLLMNINPRLLAYLVGPFVLFPLAGLYLLRARRMQPFLILMAASLLYIGAVMVVFYLLFPDPAGEIGEVMERKPWLILVGIANVFLGVILAGTLLKLSRTMQLVGVAALAVFALGGSRLIFQDVPTVVWILSGTAGSTLGVLFVWLVFKLFIWLQERRRWLTPEILDAYFCWTYLTLYLAFWVWGLGQAQVRVATLVDSEWLFGGLGLSLVLFIVVLHTLLLRARAQRPKLALRRLLLPRVFGGADERADLLDALDDTWRRIGAIDLLVANDVASRTLGASMLEAFLLRRSEDEFIKTGADVDARLGHLRSEIEGDVRYPVNGVYCEGDIWQKAFARLAEEASAVLMDVRGFTTKNRSSAWELRHLVQHTRLQRVVFLGDDHTDRDALEQEARAAWSRLSSESPNAGAPEPLLTELSFTRWTDAERITLFKLLSSAVAGRGNIGGENIGPSEVERNS